MPAHQSGGVVSKCSDSTNVLSRSSTTGTCLAEMVRAMKATPSTCGVAAGCQRPAGTSSSSTSKAGSKRLGTPRCLTRVVKTAKATPSSPHASRGTSTRSKFDSEVSTSTVLRVRQSCASWASARVLSVTAASGEAPVPTHAAGPRRLRSSLSTTPSARISCLHGQQQSCAGIQGAFQDLCFGRRAGTPLDERRRQLSRRRRRHRSPGLEHERRPAVP